MQPTRAVSVRFLRRALRLASVFADPQLHYRYDMRARQLSRAVGESPYAAAFALREFRRDVSAEVRGILKRAGFQAMGARIIPTTHGLYGVILDGQTLPAMDGFDSPTFARLWAERRGYTIRED